MNRAEYKLASGAYRKGHRRSMAIGFHSAGIPSQCPPKPLGFSFRVEDRLETQRERRSALLRKLRDDRAELARRAFIRSENKRLGIVCVADYIVTDEIIRGGMEAAHYFYLSKLRGEQFPLTSLVLSEGNVEIIASFRRMIGVA